MNKTLAALLVLGTGAALLTPPAVAYAKDGDDDRIENAADRGGDDDRGPGRGSDDTPTPGSGDDTPDQGSGDNGGDDAPTPGSDDGTPDQGSGDNGGDDAPTPGSDDGTPDQGSGDGTGTGGGSDDDADRRRDGKVDVRRAGQCSADSVWRLRVRVKDDRSRIKLQVKTAVAGENWTYAITDNGTEVTAGTRQTRGRSADFTVQHKRRSGGAGAHDVTAVAQNSVTGETCSGAAVA